MTEVDEDPGESALDRGARLRGERDWEGATEAFEQAVDAGGPDEAEAWFWLAATWEDRRDPHTAVDCYREALAAGLDGDAHTVARLWLARALLAAKRPEEAISVIEDTDVVEGSELDDLAWSIYRRAKRRAWRLAPSPDVYVTKAELVTAGIGLLCLAATFLPWLTIHGDPYDPALPNVWQLSWTNGVLLAACAAVLVVAAVRTTNRRATLLGTALADVILAGLGIVGLVRACVVVYLYTTAPAVFFPNFDDVSVRPHLGPFVEALLVLALAAVTVRQLVRARAETAAHSSAARVG